MKQTDIEFECSYCGNIWISNSFKISVIKGKNKKFRTYCSVCPKCNREVTLVKEMKG